jgi:hypothetical protein
MSDAHEVRQHGWLQLTRIEDNAGRDLLGQERAQLRSRLPWIGIAETVGN